MNPIDKEMPLIISDRMWKLDPNEHTPIFSYCRVTKKSGWAMIEYVRSHMDNKMRPLLPEVPTDGCVAYTNDWDEEIEWRYDLRLDRWINQTFIEYVNEHRDDLIGLGWTPPEQENK